MTPNKSTALIALLIIHTHVVSTVADDTDGRPNILWLTSEDNSVDWIGCYGNPQVTTPSIDQLAAQGFRYTHCYANAPVCAPMRSTWITGVMAISMGTHPMRSVYKIPHDKIKLYPDLLNDRGYYTGNWKKMDYNFGGRDGAECWDNPNEVNWDALKNQQPFFQVINFTSSHESRAFGEVENTRHTPAETQIATYHPDVPDMRKNYAHYQDAVQNMDREIGNAIKKLESSGLADNTIVVYCSDHGGVLPRSKRFLFQNSLHCPLIVRIPDRYRELWPADKPGSQVDRLVSFVDMPKTWLSLTGSEVPETMQGRCFLGPQAEPEGDYHFAFRGRMDERIDNARAIVDKRFLYIRNYMPYAPWMQRLTYLWNMKATQAWDQAVRNGTANDVQARFFAPKGWTEELYDMQNDPDNINNLIDQPEHRQTVDLMRRRLRKQQLKIHDSGLLPETERVRLAAKHDTTIYEMVRDPSLYNLPALLDAADLALAKDPANAAQLRALLDHSDVGMRYWGIVGCFLLNDPQAGEIAIDDDSHEVRAMAAWLSVRSGKQKLGLECLQDLIQQQSYALLTVLNIIDWIGDEAKPLIPAIGDLKFKPLSPKQHKYKIRMRDIVLERFGKLAQSQN
jgi:arylsulfatase A-like enzyme